MCRIAASFSVKPSGMAAELCLAPKSLLAQASAVKGREQKDGWGVAWYAGKAGPEVVKSPNPVYKESGLFRKTAAKAVSGTVIAHIRWASNPLGLAKSELLGKENTQPFSRGRFIFAHNGTLNIPSEIAGQLGRYAKELRGCNDSEVLFYQFLKMTDSCGDPGKAFEMMLEEINAAWPACRKDHPGKAAPYKGLNFFAADGERLWLLRHFPMPKDTGALMTPRWKYGRIAYRLSPGRLVAASEPLDNGRWDSLENLEVAEVWAGKNSVRLLKRKIRERVLNRL